MFSNSMYSGATYFQSAHAMHSNSLYSNPSMGLAPHGLNAGSGGDPPEDHGGEAAALAQGATAPGGYRLGDVARQSRDNHRKSRMRRVSGTFCSAYLPSCDFAF